MIEILIVVLTLMLLIVFFASLLAVIFPFKPFRTRKRALISIPASVVAFVVVVSLFPTDSTQTLIGKTTKSSQTEEAGGTLRPSEPNQSQTTETNQGALSEGVKISNDIPEPCGDGGLVLNDIVAVSGQHEVRTAPNSDAEKIKNIKASNALKSTHYHSIDMSTTVRRLCAQADWTEVQIVTPDWLTHLRGWVPTDAVRTIERTTSGQRIYVVEDFYWDDDATQFKEEIVAIANRIKRENSNCQTIDTASVALSASRSKPEAPVFFITCNSADTAFNVWFNPDEADANTGAFVAKEPVNRSVGADACEAYAKSIATHPSTVSFSRVWDLAYQTFPSGRARIVSSFKAKNALNLELKYRIECIFEGSVLLEAAVTEARN